jgi:aerobic C4-dicarboxylate transport protein
MAARRARFGLVGQLWFQVLVGTAAGVALGWFAPAWGAAMKPFGDGFIALVRMLVPPVVFCTVVHGVGRAGEAGAVGRVAGKALLYFLALTLVALVLALAAVNLTQPGAGMNVAVRAIDARPVAAYAAAARHQSPADFMLGLIPSTFGSAFTDGNVLQVLLVSVLFGFALAGAGETGRPVLRLVEALSGVFFRIVGIVMWVAPIGAFGAIAFTVAKFGAGSLVGLGKLIAEFYLVSAAFVVLVLGAVAWAAGVSLLRLIGYLRDELVIVAATTSTETVLPRLMQKLEDLGCEEQVVGLVVPTGYAFNLDGTCLYIATAAVFLAQATNTPLSLAQQLSLIAVALVTTKGAAAVPGAAFVVLAATLGALNVVPVVSIALVLGVHRLLAEAMTFVNLLGNALAAIVVARWEGAVDLTRLSARVGLRRLAPAAA